MEVKVPYQVSLNLLPRKYIAQRTPNWIRLFFIAVLLVLSFFYFLSYGVLSVRIQALEQEIGVLQLQERHLREEEQRLRRVQEEVARIEGRVRLLESLIARERDWLRFFAVLGENMPGDLALSEIQCSAERVECRGRAQTVASIAGFISGLSRHSELFTTVEFTSLTLDQNNLYEFALTMELKHP